MTQFWNDLEGVSLAGRYWLKQCLSAAESEAWYLIRLDPERDAAVRVVRADAPFAPQKLDAWREAIAIDHDHITRLYDAGEAEAEGVGLIYAVCEWPDDFLAAALVDRPLSTAEATDVLRAAVAALRYLHGNGWVHGAIDPRHIMAVGDCIKLPVDTVWRNGASGPPAETDDGDAPELRAGQGPTPASDMWSLGMTLIEILTRTRPTLDPDSEVPFLPEPFGGIARNVLRHDPASRWTIDEVESHLLPPESAPEPVVLPPTPALIVAEPEEPAPPPPPRVRSGLPMKWVPLAGLVAAAALSVVFLRHPQDNAVPAAAPAAPATQPMAAPPPQPKPVQAESRTAAIWRVVAYEFHKRSQAEKKASTLNQKHPELRAEVFAPRGNRAPYFVSLGGRLTFEKAEELRRRARASGLPRDTFVRNFAN